MKRGEIVPGVYTSGAKTNKRVLTRNQLIRMHRRKGSGKGGAKPEHWSKFRLPVGWDKKKKEAGRKARRAEEAAKLKRSA